MEGYSWVKGIKFGKFFIRNWNLTPPAPPPPFPRFFSSLSLSKNNYPLESMYISLNSTDMTTLRLRGIHVPSSRIGFVREIRISFYSRSSGTPKQIQSQADKFKEKSYEVCLIRNALKCLGPLDLKKDFLNLCTKSI